MLLVATLSLHHEAVLVLLVRGPAGLQHEGVHPGADLARGDRHVLGHARPEVQSADGVCNSRVSVMAVNVAYRLVSYPSLSHFPDISRMPMCFPPRQPSGGARPQTQRRRQTWSGIHGWSPACYSLFV